MGIPGFRQNVGPVGSINFSSVNFVSWYPGQNWTVSTRDWLVFSDQQEEPK
jgi:hypothetical protein